MLRMLMRAQNAVARVIGRAGGRSDSGQTTSEYALVTLGAAAVALLVAAWAGRTGKISELLDAVVDRVLGNL
ncbi:MAG: DUF4244 domain-containing protein [Acidimicrobiales bacterium]